LGWLWFGSLGWVELVGFLGLGFILFYFFSLSYFQHYSNYLNSNEI